MIYMNTGCDTCMVILLESNRKLWEYQRDDFSVRRKQTWRDEHESTDYVGSCQYFTQDFALDCIVFCWIEFVWQILWSVIPHLQSFVLSCQITICWTSLLDVVCTPGLVPSAMIVKVVYNDFPNPAKAQMLHISVGWSSGVINSNSRTFVFPHFSFCLVFLCSCYSTSCSLTRGSGRWEKPSSRSAEVKSDISSEAGTKLRPVPVNPPPAHGSYGSDMFFHPTFLQTLQTWPRPLKLSQTEGLNPAFQSRLQQKQRLTEGGWKNILSLCWVSFLFFLFQTPIQPVWNCRSVKERWVCCSHAHSQSTSTKLKLRRLGQS